MTKKRSSDVCINWELLAATAVLAAFWVGVGVLLHWEF